MEHKETFLSTYVQAIDTRKDIALGFNSVLPRFHQVQLLFKPSGSICLLEFEFVCVEVLQPSQPNGVLWVVWPSKHC